jgi:thymidylate kinase
LVLFRYWHSTAAYALAHELTSHTGKGDTTMEDYIWPSDLLKPDLVLFLVVSEEVRRYRHAFRNTTNTKEEQTLANDGIFRQK